MQFYHEIVSALLIGFKAKMFMTDDDDFRIMKTKSG